MLLIPAALISGIIEDKIANELTNNDKSTKKHLEEIKRKIQKHKNDKFDVQIFYLGEEEPLCFSDVSCVHIENNYLLMTSEEDGLIAITLNNATQYRIKQRDNNNIKIKF